MSILLILDVHPPVYRSQQQMISKVDDNNDFDDSHDDDDDRFNDNDWDTRSYDDCLDTCERDDDGDDCLNQFHRNDDDVCNDHDDDLKVEFNGLAEISSPLLNNCRVCSVLMYLINLSLTSPRQMTCSLDFVIFLPFNRSFDDSSQSFVIVI